ncbi:MAG: ketopantoate reductase family protein, partial [Solirubrobacteraceae bacterium]
MIDASVLVVGGGAIGGITAAKLAGTVRRVVVLDADERHVALLREPGLTYEEAGAQHTVALDAVGSPDQLDGEFDFALVAVKSPFHEAALEPLVARGGIDAFVSLGNGLIQDRMAQLVGADRLLSCIVEWGGTNLGPGHVVRDTIAPMVVGELDGSQRPRTQLLARCLEAVGDVRLTRNVRGQIWSKLLVNSAFTGLSAVSGL